MVARMLRVGFQMQTQKDWGRDLWVSCLCRCAFHGRPNSSLSTGSSRFCRKPYSLPNFPLDLQTRATAHSSENELFRNKKMDMEKWHAKNSEAFICTWHLPGDALLDRKKRKNIYVDMVVRMICCDWTRTDSDINPLKTKRRLLYLKTQYVPRSKHFSSRLEKQISLWYKWHKSLFVLR